MTTDWEISQASSCDFLLRRCGLPPNSLNRFISTLLCVMIQFPYFFCFSFSSTLKMEKLTNLENLIKKILHLQWSIISWKLSNTQAGVGVWRSKRNFKTNFCVLDRMFDHFLPAASISPSEKLYETFLCCNFYRIQLFCIITLCLFIALSSIELTTQRSLQAFFFVGRVFFLEKFPQKTGSWKQAEKKFKVWCPSLWRNNKKLILWMAIQLAGKI